MSIYFAQEMTTCMHLMYPPKIEQIGWGHDVNVCVWKKSSITFANGCILYMIKAKLEKHRLKGMYYIYVCLNRCNDSTLQWRHNGCDSISSHQPHHCLLNRLFRRRSKKTSKLHVTGLCAGNSPETGEFPAHMASNAEKVSIWWRHHPEVQFSCAITQPLLAHHWRVHQCLLTSLFIAPSIPWGKCLWWQDKEAAS